MKKFKIIVSSILMCIILFVVFVFSDDKELQKDVVEKMTDTIVDIATNESTTEILSLTAEDEQILEVQETTENEAFKEQRQVAYEGAEKTPYIQLEDYA